MRKAPDNVVVHPPTRCDSCARDLTDPTVDRVVRRQVFDTLGPVLICTEHRSITLRCSCGARGAGTFPLEARAPVTYGPRTSAEFSPDALT